MLWFPSLPLTPTLTNRYVIKLQLEWGKISFLFNWQLLYSASLHFCCTIFLCLIFVVVVVVFWFYNFSFIFGFFFLSIFFSRHNKKSKSYENEEEKKISFLIFPLTHIYIHTHTPYSCEIFSYWRWIKHQEVWVRGTERERERERQREGLEWK